LPSESAPGLRRILLALALLGAVFFLSLRGIRPPPPKPASAPAAEFSAERAREVLYHLVGDGVPHPAGSPADDAVREAILAEFKKLGYAPEVQPGFACDEYGTCAAVNNVVARLEGSSAGQAVLVAAHYDSVPAGPGASDDGVGAAAVLEIARALKSRPQPIHSVVFLIDEGEEAGLLGAHVFVDSHPWAKEVRAAVNIDNRGTSGASLMFETGSANEWAVRLYAAHASRPATSSIFYAAYKTLPNDTDFTVFKAAGYQGLNFAFIGDVMRYHTRLDNFENADPSSIQHHGENALPMVAALANSALSNPPQCEAVYFDVFGRWVIWWPALWTFSIALGALLLLVFEAAWLVYKKRLTAGAFLWGIAAWIGVLLISGGAAFLLRWVLKRAGAIPVNWVAHPLPVEAAFWSLGFAIVVLVSIAVARRTGFAGMWSSAWIWWALGAAAVARIEPGFSYVLLVPAAIAALAGAPFAFWPRQGDESRRGEALAAIVPLVAAAIVSFAAIIQLYAALGNNLLPLTSILVALVLTPLAPLLPDLTAARPLPRLVLLAAVIGVPALAIFGAIVAPSYSAKSPERVNLEYWLDSDAGKGQWLVRADSGRLPEPLRVAAKFQRTDKGPFPWSRVPAFLADAPHLVLNAPTFTILESSVAGDTRSYRALLRSERGAPDALVMFPPASGIGSVRMEGVPVHPQSERISRYLSGWTLFDCVTMPDKGVELTFTLPAGKPVEVYVLDQSHELPLEGMFLLKARPLTATTSQDGDGTLVSRRVQLLP
jgi:Peptidase family M28